MPAIKAATGLSTCFLDEGGGLFLCGTTDFADHYYGLGVGVLVEELDGV